MKNISRKFKTSFAILSLVFSLFFVCTPVRAADSSTGMLATNETEYSIRDDYDIIQSHWWSSHWPYNNIIPRSLFHEGYYAKSRIVKKKPGLGIRESVDGSANIVLYNDRVTFNGELMDNTKMYLSYINIPEFADSDTITVYAKPNESSAWTEVYSGAPKRVTFDDTSFLYSKVIFNSVSQIGEVEVESYYKPQSAFVDSIKADTQNTDPKTLVAHSAITVQNAETNEWIWKKEAAEYKIPDNLYYTTNATDQVGAANSTFEYIDSKLYREVENNEVLRDYTYARVLDWLSIRNVPDNTVAYNLEKDRYNITTNGPVFMPGGRRNLPVNEVTYVMYLPKNIFVDEDYKVGDKIGDYEGRGTWRVASLNKEIISLNGENRQKVTIGFQLDGNHWWGANATINSIPLYTNDFETYKPQTTFSYPTRLVIGGYDQLDRNHINDTLGSQWITPNWYKDVEASQWTPDGKKLVDNGKEDWVFPVNAPGKIPDGVKITYDANKGIGEVIDDVEYIISKDAIVASADELTREHHTSIEWNTQENGQGTPYSPNDNITMNENVTLYAQWRTNSYILTYNSTGGSDVEPETVKFNELFTRKEDPTFIGHEFAGWYLDAEYLEEYDFTTPATKDITVYAKWNKNPYTISYESNGGSEVNPETVLFEELFTKPESPILINHTFGGWYLDAEYLEEYDFTTPATKDITVYAKWNKNPYTIIYEPNGGSEVDSETVLFKELFTKPENPILIGHTFAGWYSDVEYLEEYDFTMPATKDITVYAKWNKNPYTITYESNGGSEVNPETVLFEELFTKPDNPILTGHTFDGWYSDAKYLEEFDFTTPATKDITVYAKWTKDEVPVLPGTGISNNYAGLIYVGMGSIVLLFSSLERRKRL